ncbi:uncharacterized protein LOC143231552 [Tachypleus tridentatus]|uniref:uncharacterized protein LOC143231552 n=1 Tax=Tachypleus tridentatus TaxID=6853 RepID=UPI003FD1FAA0
MLFLHHGITTILTVITNSSGVKHSIPRVVRPSNATNRVSGISSKNNPTLNIKSEDLIKTMDDSDDDESEEMSFDILRYLPMASEELGRGIDRVCRALFPLIFALFNLIYWFTCSYK